MGKLTGSGRRTKPETEDGRNPRKIHANVRFTFGEKFGRRERHVYRSKFVNGVTSAGHRDGDVDVDRGPGLEEDQSGQEHVDGPEAEANFGFGFRANGG